MEMENPLLVEENRLPSDHAIHFHVSESECKSRGHPIKKHTHNCSHVVVGF